MDVVVRLSQEVRQTLITYKGGSINVDADIFKRSFEQGPRGLDCRLLSKLDRGKAGKYRKSYSCRFSGIFDQGRLTRYRELG